MITALLAGLALFALSGRKSVTVARNANDPEDSTGEGYVSHHIEQETEPDEPYADLLGDAIGAPYWYGKGSPATKWDDIHGGVDCSGAVQMALVRLGLLDSRAVDRSAAALADASDPIPVGEQRPGDMAFYGGHVMLVYSFPRADGHSSVWGMHGGGKNTLGNDPSARLDVMDTALYWPSAFVTYGRLKEATS